MSREKGIEVDLFKFKECKIPTWPLKDNIKFIKTVRGLGSMTAVELDNLDICRAVQRHAREQGLILITATQVGSALRLLYPLTIQDSVFDEGLDILIKSLEHIWNNQ